jgi:hypothetical protein
MFLSRLALCALLLMSLSAIAEDPPADKPGEAGSESKPATPSAPAMLEERSQLEAEALAARLPSKEQQNLQALGEHFLALWQPANTGTPRGLVIVIPGAGESADWPIAVGPLRRKLPDAGWHTLSLTLPDAPLPPALAVMHAAADASKEQSPAATETPAPNAARGSESATPDAASAAPPQSPQPERVFARIDAALAFAQQRETKTVVLLGHGTGAYWVARFVAERKSQQLKHLLLVAPEQPENLGSTPLEDLAPPLEVAIGDLYYEDLPADREAALRRRQAAKRVPNKDYAQVVLKAMPADRDVEQEQLARRVRGWLDKVLPDPNKPAGPKAATSRP